MTLEDVVKKYGMNDYLDLNTGYIYLLSKAKDNNDGTMTVYVEDVNDNLIGKTILNVNDCGV